MLRRKRMLAAAPDVSATRKESAGEAPRSVTARHQDPDQLACRSAGVAPIEAMRPNAELASLFWLASST